MHSEIPEDIYREHIIELYKSPANFGNLENKTNEKTVHNSVCGDEITVQLLVKEGIISNAKFSGSGCVVSIVSSSMLMDKLKGMEVSQAKKITGEEMLKILKMKLNPARIKCALLALEAVKGALR